MGMDEIDSGTQRTMVKAKELHGKMECIIQSNQNVEIQSPSVDKIDTTALQRLFDFHQALAKANHKLAWPNPSEKVIATAKLLNMDEYIDLGEH